MYIHSSTKFLDLFATLLTFTVTGDGKDEGLKFTNPEDEVNWEEEQKVCSFHCCVSNVHFLISAVQQYTFYLIKPQYLLLIFEHYIPYMLKMLSKCVA